MNRTLLLTALLVLAGTASAHQDNHDTRGRDIDKINSGITAEAGQAYGELSTVNGGIRIGDNATVRDVETVNGSIQAGDGIRSGGLSTVNGSIHVGTRARIDGSVETVNGGIFIDRGGNVKHGVATVNGAIGLVDTDLGSGIETVNGDITVGVGSHVRGGIHVEKPGKNWGLRIGKPKVPRVVIGPNAVVEGALVFEREVRLYVHQSARIGPVTGASAQRYNTASPPKD